MNGAGADGGDKIERLGEGFSPVVLTAGHGAKAEFAVIARWRVNAECTYIVALERMLELIGRHADRKAALDCRKAGRGGGIDALQQRTVGEKVVEVNRKPRHRLLPCANARGRID